MLSELEFTGLAALRYATDTRYRSVFKSVATALNGTLLRPFTLTVFTVCHEAVLEYSGTDHFWNVARVAILGDLTVAVRVNRSPSSTCFVEEDSTGLATVLAAARPETDAAEVVASAGAPISASGDARPSSNPAT